MGDLCDGINGLWYLAEGDNLNAGLSFSAMIPIAGIAVIGAKWGIKAIKGAKNVGGRIIQAIERRTGRILADETGAIRLVRKSVSTGVGKVGKGLKIDNLPLAKHGEDLYVGTYSKSTYWNKKTGLNTTHTPHHVVQDAVSGTSHGRGITINIRQDIHKLTETFGSSRNLPNPRQHLAADIKEMRNLLKQFGYDRSTINAQLWELSKQNKALGGFTE